MGTEDAATPYARIIGSLEELGPGPMAASPLQAVLSLQCIESICRHARSCLAQNIWALYNHLELLEQLWTVPACREIHTATGNQDSLRREAAAVWQRKECSRLDTCGRSCDSHMGNPHPRQSRRDLSHWGSGRAKQYRCAAGHSSYDGARRPLVRAGLRPSWP